MSKLPLIVVNNSYGVFINPVTLATNTPAHGTTIASILSSATCKLAEGSIAIFDGTGALVGEDNVAEITTANKEFYVMYSYLGENVIVTPSTNAEVKVTVACAPVPASFKLKITDIIAATPKIYAGMNMMLEAKEIILGRDGVDCPLTIFECNFDGVSTEGVTATEANTVDVFIAAVNAKKNSGFVASKTGTDLVITAVNPKKRYNFSAPPATVVYDLYKMPSGNLLNNVAASKQVKFSGFSGGGTSAENVAELWHTCRRPSMDASIEPCVEDRKLVPNPIKLNANKCYHLVHVNFVKPHLNAVGVGSSQTNTLIIAIEANITKDANYATCVCADSVKIPIVLGTVAANVNPIAVIPA